MVREHGGQTAVPAQTSYDTPQRTLLCLLHVMWGVSDVWPANFPMPGALAQRTLRLACRREVGNGCTLPSQRPNTRACARGR